MNGKDLQELCFGRHDQLRLQRFCNSLGGVLVPLPILAVRSRTGSVAGAVHINFQGVPARCGAGVEQWPLEHRHEAVLQALVVRGALVRRRRVRGAVDALLRVPCPPAAARTGDSRQRQVVDARELDERCGLGDDAVDASADQPQVHVVFVVKRGFGRERVALFEEVPRRGTRAHNRYTPAPVAQVRFGDGQLQRGAMQQPLVEFAPRLERADLAVVVRVGRQLCEGQ